MKEKMLPFSFSKGEISTQRVISNHRSLSVRDLSILTRKSESSVSQIVRRLETKGIVESERKGMKKIVDTSDRNYAITFSEMIKNEPNTPWEKILSNSNIAVLMSDKGALPVMLERIAVHPSEIRKKIRKNSGMFVQKGEQTVEMISLFGLDALEKLGGVLEIDMKNKTGKVNI